MPAAIPVWGLGSFTSYTQPDEDMYYSKTIDNHLRLHSWGISCLVMEPEEKAAYPSRNDLLWKGIQEELSDDFLRFFFPDADTRFDLQREPEYLDKELEQLFPPEDEQFAPRHVDKLIRVFTRNGNEASILLHCEVQGYEQSEFPERMFRYYSRLWDKYSCPIAAIAILTDDDKRFRPDRYEQSFMGTSLTYRFNSYKVLDQSAAELEKSENPFAMVILTVKAALEAKRGLDDREIYKLKLDLARRLHKKRIPEKKKRALMNFLRYYLRFREEAMNLKFEKSINKLTGRTETMGIEELLLAQARHEGEARGEAKGEARGEAKGEARGEARGIKRKERAFVQALVNETDFDDKKIASLADVTIDFVKKTRAECK